MGHINNYKKEIAKIIKGKKPREAKEAVEIYNKEHNPSFKVNLPHVSGNTNLYIMTEHHMICCAFNKFLFLKWWTIVAK